MAEKQPSNRHPTHRQVGQGSPRPLTGRPANHPRDDYCTLVLGLVRPKVYSIGGVQVPFRQTLSGL